MVCSLIPTKKSFEKEKKKPPHCYEDKIMKRQNFTALIKSMIPVIS